MKKIIFILTTTLLYQVSYSQTYTVKQDPIINGRYTIKKESDAYSNPKYILPKTYNYGNFKDAFNNAYNQGIQNSANLSQIRANRSNLELQRLKIQEAAEKRRVIYEEKAVKNPYLDFQKGFRRTFKKLKIKKKKYDINYFQPQSWQYFESRDAKISENKYPIVLARQLSDGTSIKAFITITNELINGLTAGEMVKRTKDNINKISETFLGYDYDNDIRTDDGYLKIKSITPNSPFEDAGILEGDALISVDGKSTKNVNDFSTLNFTKNKKPGEIVNVEVRRDSITINGPIKVKRRDGFFRGDIRISSYPGFFYTIPQVVDLYGEKQEILYYRNYAVMADKLIYIFIEIKPKSLDGNMDFEFRRFKNSVMALINNIKIKKS